MFTNKKSIIKFHDELINEIDVFFEKKLILNLGEKLNSIRNEMITKIKQIQTYNLSNVGHEYKYCFFVDNVNDLGQLIIVNNISLNEDNLSFELMAKTKIILDLINQNPNVFIQDLTDVKNNVLPNITLSRLSETIEEGSFNFMPQLINVDEVKRLELINANSPIQQLPNEIFKFFENLKELKFYNENIRKIDEYNFKSLEKLEYLELNSCQIYSIENNAFCGLKNLEKLILTNNFIDRIPSDTFNDLKNLKYLNLVKNRIESIHIKTFTDLVNLNELYLSENRLIKFEPNFFGLKNLKVLVI